VTRDAGTKSIEAFWSRFEQGIIPLPFGPALAEDLFEAYRTFCVAHDVRPVLSHRFIPWVMLNAGVHRITPNVPEPLIGAVADSIGARKRKVRHRRRVMLVGHRPQASVRREHGFMLSALRKFRFALEVWRRDLQKSLGAGEAGEGQALQVVRV
jgi:hypothetical protein